MLCRVNRCCPFQKKLASIFHYDTVGIIYGMARLEEDSYFLAGFAANLHFAEKQL